MRLQKPKSITAAEATREINPDLQVEAHLNKVCPATESIYSDTFYSRSNVVITALDNVEARRYVDRSVDNLPGNVSLVFTKWTNGVLWLNVHELTDELYIVDVNA